MELLYQVDEDDRVVGAVGRDEAHAKGILHRSGMVLLSRGGLMVIQRRSPNKATFPGLYDASASFHVRFGETYEVAAQRELEEETGIRAAVSLIGRFVHHDPPEHQFVAVFEASGTADVRVDPAESAGFELVGRDGVDRLISSGMVTPWLRDGWRLARSGGGTRE
jgi:isopentenyldiphosphate isomerase